MSEKVYFGNGKEVEFNDGGKLLKISFNRDDLNKMIENLGQSGWINLKVSRRQSPSQYGHTHSIMLDTWQPTNQGGQSQPKQAPQPRPQNQHGSVPTFEPPPMPSFDSEPEDNIPF